MAKNGSNSDERIASVKDRGQTRDPRTGLWTTRGTGAERFLGLKKSGGAFKYVRREG